MYKRQTQNETNSQRPSTSGDGTIVLTEKRPNVLGVVVEMCIRDRGMTELDVMAELCYAMAVRGGKTSFGCIAASGPNSSMPHAQPTMRKLQNGDFLTMDFGCKIEGYCSDMTRTVAIGQPSDEMKEIYQIVLDAQQRALDKIAPGMVCNDVDFAARGYIAEKGYGEYFGLSLIHIYSPLATKDNSVARGKTDPWPCAHPHPDGCSAWICCRRCSGSAAFAERKRSNL